MQVVFATFDCSYTHMQLNLKYNFLYILHYVLSKLLNNFLKSLESHVSIKMFEIYFKISFWNIWINMLKLNW